MVEYTNRRKKKYHLLKSLTKLGKPKYYFSTKQLGEPVEAIPEGFEIWEDPANANVLLRKLRPRKVTDEEIGIVEAAMKQYSVVKAYRIDIDGARIVIYADCEKEERISKFSEMCAGFGVGNVEEKMAEALGESAIYLPMLRFTLEDEESRKFRVERWCYRGSIDDWMFLEGIKDLKILGPKYCKHLGKESFYDLL